MRLFRDRAPDLIDQISGLHDLIDQIVVERDQLASRLEELSQERGQLAEQVRRVRLQATRWHHANSTVLAACAVEIDTALETP